MTKLRLAVPLLATTLALAACAHPEGKPSIYEGTCAPGSTAALASVDWSKARTFDVTISPDGFDPMVFRLVQQRPYVFHFNNADDGPRVVTAVGFFTKQAIASATVGGKTVERPCMSALNLAAGQKAEVRLVAIEKGNYGFSGAPFLYIPLTRTADTAILTVD